MKRYAPWLILIALMFGAVLLAQVNQPVNPGTHKYKVVEVKQLTKAETVTLSKEYLNYAYADLQRELPNTKLFAQIVSDGGEIPKAEEADAVVLECKIIGFDKGNFMAIPYVLAEVKLTQRSTHTLLKHFRTGKLALNNGSHLPSDERMAKFTGKSLAEAIRRELK